MLQSDATLTPGLRRINTEVSGSCWKDRRLSGDSGGGRKRATVIAIGCCITTSFLTSKVSPTPPLHPLLSHPEDQDQVTPHLLSGVPQLLASQPLLSPPVQSRWVYQGGLCGLQSWREKTWMSVREKGEAEGRRPTARSYCKKRAQ